MENHSASKHSFYASLPLHLTKSHNKARRRGWSSEGVVTPREDSGRRPDKELSAICAGLFAFVCEAHEKGPAALSCIAFAQLAYVICTRHCASLGSPSI